MIQGPTLSSQELARYSRHLTLREVGVEGQLKLKAGSVLVIGAGGLGSPAALYLAAAGVGRIGIVDFDQVEVGNLQRQILHSTGDVGKLKVESARARLETLNPEIRIDLHQTRLSSSNATELLREYDVIANGSDNFPTRYLVNDACVLLGKPNVYGSVFRFEGQASVFGMPDGPCYRCLHPQPPNPGDVQDCAEAGVLGVLPGIVGLIQATEVLKLLLGVGEPLAGRLLSIDALAMSFRSTGIARSADCPACGDRQSIERLNASDNSGAGEPAGEGAGIPDGAIGPRELKTLIDRGDRLLLIDVREPEEWQICRIPGAQLIPLGKLPGSLDRVDSSADIVVYCRSGIRSARAVELLGKAGCNKVRNLTGGILAWATDVDPEMARY